MSSINSARNIPPDPIASQISAGNPYPSAPEIKGALLPNSETLMKIGSTAAKAIASGLESTGSVIKSTARDISELVTRTTMKDRYQTFKNRPQERSLLDSHAYPNKPLGTSGSLGNIDHEDDAGPINWNENPLHDAPLESKPAEVPPAAIEKKGEAKAKFSLIDKIKSLWNSNSTTSKIIAVAAVVLIASLVLLCVAASFFPGGQIALVGLCLGAATVLALSGTAYHGMETQKLANKNYTNSINAPATPSANDEEVKKLRDKLEHLKQQKGPAVDNGSEEVPLEENAAPEETRDQWRLRLDEELRALEEETKDLDTYRDNE